MWLGFGRDGKERKGKGKGKEKEKEKERGGDVMCSEDKIPGIYMVLFRKPVLGDLDSVLIRGVVGLWKNQERVIKIRSRMDYVD